MKRMLFNATQSEELRVAIVDGQKLIDLDIEHAGKEQRKSNIYKGVITRIEPSLEAAFVDYGSERHGFLPFKEVSRSYFQENKGDKKASRPRIQDVLKEGQEVIVQVDKDERGNKGAALTTFISLAGRYLVLMPNNPRGGGVSRRVEGAERNELRDTMAQLEMPKGMSIIARTAGIGRNAEELQWDLNYLTQLWTAIEDASQLQPGAYLIYQEGSLVIRAIRDYFSADIGEILIDTQDVHEQAVQFMNHVMPGNVSRVKLYEEETPLFSRFQIEHQIESAFSREVRLPSGGAIVIDHTEALVSIDVNSGRSIKGADIEHTAFNTNIEAAEEVARQMRLRDLGGLVVIDFIDMENAKNQREVENAVKESLHYDRARVQTSKISRFGLMELSRQRLRPSIGEANHATCPRCTGTGHIRGTESTALHILRITQEEAMKDQSAIIQVQLPVDAATFLLNEKRADIHKVEELTGVEVVLIPNIHMETPNYSISRIKHDDVTEDLAKASYKMMELPPETDYERGLNETDKPVKAEAIVKGVTSKTAAPIVEEKPKQIAEQPAVPAQRTSIFGKVKAWLGLTPAEQKEKEEEETKAQPEAKPRSGQGNRNNRNNRNRNRNNRDRNGEKNERGNRESRPAQEKQAKPQQKSQQQNDKAKAADNPRNTDAPKDDTNKEARQERGGRRNRRGRRRPREDGAEQSAANNVNQNNAPTTEAKPTVTAESKPADTKVAEAKAVEAKPAETKAPTKKAEPKAVTVDATTEAKPKPAKKPRAPRKTAAKKAEESIDLVETKATTKPVAEAKAEPAKKPARKPRAKPAAKKATNEAQSELQLVETKAAPKAKAKPAAKKAPAKAKKPKTAKKEAAWKKSDDTKAADAPLVMVETQKTDK